jgi:hypothetical protein
MFNHQDGRSELLISSEVGDVNTCAGCGQVHLIRQYLPLRFDAVAFRMLVTMISQAQHFMVCAAAAKPAALPISPAGGVH